MADVQKENGYIPLACELAEAFSRQVISADEWRILWVIIRKTYGWGKKEDWISLSQFVLATGMKKAHVCRAIGKLKSRNIITQTGNGITQTGNGITQTGNAVGHRYAIQKDYAEWKRLPKQVRGKKSVTQIGKDSLPKQGPTKDTKQKKVVKVPELQIPGELDNDGFLSAWEDWKEYRRSKKKPLTVLQQNRAMRALARFGSSWAISRIDLSITNGWTGLIFPEDRKRLAEQEGKAELPSHLQGYVA